MFLPTFEWSALADVGRRVQTWTPLEVTYCLGFCGHRATRADDDRACMRYWMHRLFHGRRLWRFHAVHHSSVDLDWLSAVRLHPVNDALMRIAGAVPLLALGFAPVAIVGIAPVVTVMAILVHANLDWDWGPLRGVLASPRFHRWHHTDEANARDKNFAGLLPVWDLLFGTYYMPRNRLPQQFGTSSPVPAGLVGQILFPFRSG
jgi:sterol desaturase/sphingolipid hydroxylase (fatty acid hydroxylase superfamily)